jgi:hypothetical protein
MDLIGVVYDALRLQRELARVGYRGDLQCALHDVDGSRALRRIHESPAAVRS